MEEWEFSKYGKELNSLKKVTWAVYKVTDLFPPQEPLRFQLRNIADEILFNVLLLKKEKSLELIELILEILDFPELEKWARKENFFVLKKEYRKIRESLVNKEEISPRQKEILNILKREKRVQVKTLQKFFPQLSKRTLRRDLEELVKLRKVKRIGKWNLVSYELLEDRS